MGKRGKRASQTWVPLRRRGWPVDWRRQPADLQPVSRRPLAMQAADQLRRRITLGDLKPGQRIESARKLAKELRISMPVLREGIAALTYLGLVEVRHGVGMFVARRPRASRSVRAAAQRADRGELHALRETLAAEVAARAASLRRNDGRMLDLHLMLEERSLAVHSGSPDRFTRADLNFHGTLAAASGVPLHAALERMTGVALWTDLAGRARRLAWDSSLTRLHRDLMEAIEAGTPEAAVAAARAIAAAEATESG
jgi:DNA-binding FadR family transcriptional regulator